MIFSNTDINCPSTPRAVQALKLFACLGFVWFVCFQQSELVKSIKNLFPLNIFLRKLLERIVFGIDFCAFVNPTTLLQLSTSLLHCHSAPAKHSVPMQFV